MRLRDAKGLAMEVSPLLFETVGVAISVAEWSAGAVDPTVGRCVEALGYDRDFADMRTHIHDVQLTPKPTDVFFRSPTSLDMPKGASGLRSLCMQSPGPARPAPGWRSIEIDVVKRTIRVPEGTLLDLGASAKALAADRAAALICRLIDCGALVSIGGDVAVAGPPPPGGWSIGIATSSAAPIDDVDQVVSVTSGGIASSSTAVRTWHHEGRLVHHIVDPLTGANARTCWSLVSVAAPSCVAANAASTASVVWGRSAPKRLALAGLPARFVAVSGLITTTCGWPDDTPDPWFPTRVAS
jgi:thiamine biosynthesis lipoprotein